MPTTHPHPTAVHAVVVTTCPQLARQLADLHPAVRTALLTRLSGIGTLRDHDALLLLNHHDPHDPAANPDADGPATTTVYIGTGRRTAVQARAVRMHADEVLILPRDADQIAALLHEHLGAPA